jgi:long-chain acyl-CoA synthetase
MIAVRTLSLPNVIASHAILTPDAEAVICDAQRLTWKQLVDRINRVANALIGQGLRPGDKVATLLNNSIEQLELILGTIAARGVIVPLSELMASGSLAAMLENSEARYLFASEETRHRIEPISCRLAGIGPGNFILIDERAPGWTAYDDWLQPYPSSPPAVDYRHDDPVSILYTSGTTGMPKGMEHSHFSRLLYPLGLGPCLEIDHDARTILTTPLYHNGTWTTMLPTLYCGGVVVIMKKFSANVFQDLVEREHCTHAFMVPTQLVVTTADAGFQAQALKSMRLVMVSGSPLTPHTFNEWRTRLPSLSLCEIYGMGEGFMTFVGPADYALGKAGSVGRPIATVDTDIQILGDDDRPVASGEIGEIVGTSAFLLTQYYRDAVRTQEALWHDEKGRPYLRSGDLGRYDEDGYLHVVGRKKDMIISGGVKIYAVDLEDVFMQHPDVLEVAAIGIPHDKWGETPLLLAILRDGATVSEGQLCDWGNDRLGKAQRVSRVEFRKNFPRNALEKILKRELRAGYWRGMSRDI